jgi:hypothetical protein
VPSLTRLCFARAVVYFVLFFKLKSSDISVFDLNFSSSQHRLASRTPEPLDQRNFRTRINEIALLFLVVIIRFPYSRMMPPPSWTSPSQPVSRHDQETPNGLGNA